MEEIKLYQLDKDCTSDICMLYIRSRPLLILLLVLTVGGNLSYGQATVQHNDDFVGDSLNVQLATDTTVIDSLRRTVFFGLTFGNNSSYLGRYQSQIVPYYSADVTYKSKVGFWFSCIGYKVANSSGLREVDMMAGYDFNVGRSMDGSVAYTRYFFTDSVDLIKASVASTASLSSGYDWKYLYSKLSVNYAFGEANDFFVILDNSRYFEIPGLFKGNDYLSFEPKVSVIAGTQSFVETHYINQGAPLPIPDVAGGYIPTRPNGATSPATTTSTTTTSAPTTSESMSTEFGLLGYEVSMPVVYGLGKFAFEVNGRYTIPVNLLHGDTSVSRFFFSAGILYYITSK